MLTEGMIYRVFGLLAGTLLAAAVPAQQTDSTEAGLRAPVRHAEVCPGPSAPEVARCHSHIVVDSSDQPIVNVTPAGYYPSDLRSAYNVTGTGTASSTIAIVDAYGYPNAEKNLGIYRTHFGLPACTTANGCFKKVNQTGVQGSYPRFNLGWSQETALDLEMASAICPGCKILLVEATNSSFLNLATAVQTAGAMGAHVISNSYGGGESGSQTYESYYNIAGVAVTVSSGDSGYGVQFPASSPHVTAVGGTSLSHSTNSRGWSETAWNGAGSGCSAIYTKPTWQTDPLCSNRTVADVSAIADPNTGVAVYAQRTRTTSGWLVFGGTSVASPIIAGMYGLQDTAVNYGSDPYSHTSSLYDVISGSNGSCGGTYLCTAGPGYDGPTGLGTPNGSTAF
jgi:subtilase family serine protease